ncbi:MAG: hypothetical protein AAB658_04185, partial [Chloroflexota bacterium]
MRLLSRELGGKMPPLLAGWEACRYGAARFIHRTCAPLRISPASLPIRRATAIKTALGDGNTH